MRPPGILAVPAEAPSSSSVELFISSAGSSCHSRLEPALRLCRNEHSWCKSNTRIMDSCSNNLQKFISGEGGFKPHGQSRSFPHVQNPNLGPAYPSLGRSFGVGGEGLEDPASETPTIA
jgi:hypothetical protein